MLDKILRYNSISSARILLKYKNANRLKVKERKNKYHAIAVLDKIDFRTKNPTRVKEEHFIMKRGYTWRYSWRRPIILNVSIFNKRTSKCIRGK